MTNEIPRGIPDGTDAPARTAAIAGSARRRAPARGSDSTAPARPDGAARVRKPNGRGSRRRPARAERFRVVVASDGSPQSRAAVAAAVEFPWPTHTEAVAVVATGAAHAPWSRSVSAGIDSAFRDVAAATERALRLRWPDATVLVVAATPVEAILAQARGARVVVLGSHGYSKLQRWMLGSVSRSVARRATTSVLVVKERAAAIGHVVVGYDGSNHARRAVDLVASMAVPRRGRVTLLSFVDPVEAETPRALPGDVGRRLAREAKAVTRDRFARMRRALEGAARPLVAAGWRVRLDVRSGVAARDLTVVPAALGADVLVIGAQGGGWKPLMLGSVVESVLDRIPVSTLIVR
jgi:nucleotide-binding universal stress UspA family protein